MKLGDILKVMNEQSMAQVILLKRKNDGTPYQKIVFEKRENIKKIMKYIDYEVVSIRANGLTTGFKIMIRK
jgi:hypothetical protein